MKRPWILFRLLMFGYLICCSQSSGQAKDKTILCYFETNVLNSSDVAGKRFVVEDIDPNVCTHLVHCSVRLDIEKNEIIKDAELFNFNLEYVKVKALKDRNPQLKVLVILRLEQTSWDKSLVQLMDNKTSVDTFANKTTEFLQHNYFDGVNFEFYPYEHEQPGFSNLVSALKEAFSDKGYLLVYSDKMNHERINEGTEFLRLNESLDFIVLDTFNFHDSDTEPWQAAHHSPLYNQPWDEPNKSVDSVVNHWINKGFPPEKILLGIPLWGRSWKISPNKTTTPPAPADGPGSPGNCTNQSGFLGYFEICQDVKSKGWKVIQDPNKTMGPHAFSSSESHQEKYWISYDDPAMAVTKSEYIQSKGLGGAAVKDISYDDFQNKCGEGKNPMLMALRKTLKSDSIDTSTSSSIPSSFPFFVLLTLSLFLLIVLGIYSTLMVFTFISVMFMHIAIGRRTLRGNENNSGELKIIC